MTTMLTADFDTYTAIETYVFGLLADEETEVVLSEIQAFAADLGVAFTEWDLTSLMIDFEEI